MSADGLLAHCASWHKSCHLKYNNDKPMKAIKRDGTALRDDLEDDRRSIKRHAFNIQNCLFCEKGEQEGELHQILTLDADYNVRAMVTELNDVHLLARIVVGDLIAMEVKHHLKCMVNLRNRYRSLVRKSDNDAGVHTTEKVMESRVLVELTTYIEQVVESGETVFKLSEIHSLYTSRLKGLGIQKQVNKTRLKEKLLEHFVEAQAEQFDGRNIACSYFQTTDAKQVERCS